MQSLDLRNAVMLLNRVAGKPDLLETTPDQLQNLIKVQNKIVFSECRELIKAVAERDPVEFLDGICDVAYTTAYLHPLVMLADQIPSEFIRAIDEVVDAWINKNSDLFWEAMALVVENNASKFTSDKLRADSWVLAEGTFIKESEVNGVTYYCVMNAHGKMCKPSDFKSVDLTELSKKVDLTDTDYFL